MIYSELRLLWLRGVAFLFLYGAEWRERGGKDYLKKRTICLSFCLWLICVHTAIQVVWVFKQFDRRRLPGHSDEKPDRRRCSRQVFRSVDEVLLHVHRLELEAGDGKRRDHYLWHGHDEQKRISHSSDPEFSQEIFAVFGEYLSFKVFVL